MLLSLRSSVSLKGVSCGSSRPNLSFENTHIWDSGFCLVRNVCRICRMSVVFVTVWVSVWILQPVYLAQRLSGMPCRNSCGLSMMGLSSLILYCITSLAPLSFAPRTGSGRERLIHMCFHFFFRREGRPLTRSL